MKKPTPDEVWEKFKSLEGNYAQRNAKMLDYEAYFAGDHWKDSAVAQSSSDFRLVFNYCRAIVLKYTSLLARAPRVRINIAGGDATLKRRAKNREAFLIGLWPDIMTAWAKVEMNASKKKFGVLQALWQPEPGQPKSVEVGKGGDKATVRKFTKSPFIFRDIPPEYFYAVYRTYTKPDDFLYVIRHDPNRLVEDLQEKYKEQLQATDLLEGSAGTCDLLEYWDNEHYILVALTQRDVKVSGTAKSVAETTPVVLQEFNHKYGRPPFFVLQNLVNPSDDPLTSGSLGDLDDVIGLNIHYNLVSSEAAEEIITNIHRPVVYKSNDHQQDVNSLEFKAASVYPIGLDEILETLQWQGMPQAVQNHLEQIMGGIQDVSFIGQAGFGQYPSGATGVSLRLLMQSLENILVLKIPIRVTSLQSVCEFLFRIVEDKTAAAQAVTGSQGAARPKPTPLEMWMKDKLGRFGQVSISAEDIEGDYFVDVDYGNILPRAETEYQQNEVYKNKTGNQSLYTTMDNIGIESPDDEIERIRQENQDIALNPEKVSAITQAVLLQLQLQQMQQAKQKPPEGIGPQAQPTPMGQPPIQPMGQPPLGNAPPIPGMPEGGQPAGMPMGGEGLPYMGRGFGPNMAETGMPPAGPLGQPRRGLG